jgi:hypothetical protein
VADITILNFDKDGGLEVVPVVGPEITDVVLIAHGWNEGPASALGHYQDLVGPLEVILSQNKTQWQGHTVAYFGVIWPSSKYADDLTVIKMRADAGDPPPHAGVVAGLPAAPSLNDADLQARARDVAQFLGIDPDLLATQALQAAGDNGARDALVSTLQKATSERRRLRADEQTRAEYDAAFSETGSNLFSAIGGELQQLFTNVADVVADNPLIGWLKQLRGDANAKIAYILNLFAYNEMKIRAGVVGGGLADHVLNPVLADRKRIHLVGHSFGGRLMTAATAAAEGGKISNLTLLEGAFSHNALSVDRVGPINGAFKSVIDNAKVAGRIAVAHSDHDAAVWIAYPLASRVFRDSYSLSLAASPHGQVLGGPTDRYGAIGANGPQNLNGVNRLIFTGTSLPGLNPGVHALDCTSFVASHSDVWKQGSAYIVATGLLL